VLVVALIMLAVMSLLVITMIKTVVVDLEIGGASQQAAVNLANADVALNTYIGQNPAFALGCLATASCNVGLGTLDPAPTPVAGGRVYWYIEPEL
jgi:Tfp pilus assembly protein PilX